MPCVKPDARSAPSVHSCARVASQSCCFVAQDASKVPPWWEVTRKALARSNGTMTPAECAEAVVAAIASSDAAALARHFCVQLERVDRGAEGVRVPLPKRAAPAPPEAPPMLITCASKHVRGWWRLCLAPAAAVTRGAGR